MYNVNTVSPPLATMVTQTAFYGATANEEIVYLSAREGVTSLVVSINLVLA